MAETSGDTGQITYITRNVITLPCCGARAEAQNGVTVCGNCSRSYRIEIRLNGNGHVIDVMVQEQPRPVAPEVTIERFALACVQACQAGDWAGAREWAERVMDESRTLDDGVADPTNPTDPAAS